MPSIPGRKTALLCAFSALCALAPVALAAQTDSVMVVAGEHYAAGGLKAKLLGRDYRDLWTAAIRVPVLDLDTYGGGLTPVQRGGGLQTMSLRFRAPDGRQYNFRSVDKDQTGGLHPDFRNTFIDRIVQDQVSSKHPAAALMAGPIMDAAGLMHPGASLYVMPDDPRLGEHRELFAGMLGTMEIHPDEGEDGGPTFHGAVTVAGTERLLERLEESPDDRVDAREYLRARLVDLLIGDWDRHVGQWRWARYDRGDVRWWVPIPEDRDNAFHSFDGLLIDLARRRVPNLVQFGPEYSDIYGLTENAQVLDRRLLSGLPRAAFDSVALELQAALTDGVIDQAVEAAPPQYRGRRADEIAAALRARREALPAAATRFYDQLAGEVEIRGTDESETALVEVLDDGSVEVRLLDEERTYLSRRFLPGETREVRIHLHGGADRAVIRGEQPSGVLVRVIGGGGDDVLADSTTARGGRPITFYDDRGENVFVRAPGTIVDERPFTPPGEPVGGFNDNAPPFRDWGRAVFLFEPVIGWRYNVGPVIGGGPRVTRYGFRRVPYAHTIAARALWAPLETRFGIEGEGDFRRTNSPAWTTVRVWASQLDVTRFHGFGNQTPGDGPSALYKVQETEIGIEPLYHRALGTSVEAFAGPVFRYTWPDAEPGSPAAAELGGSSAFGQLGAQAGMGVDTRDLASYPRRGIRGALTASAFGAMAGASAPFGALEGFAATYLPLPLPLETTVAMRVGGRSAWGEFPLQEAAFVGGPGSLRGHPRQRWAGESAVFAGAELRSFVTRFNFISRGDLGVIALADAGRVFVDGDSEGDWHSGFGGGIWLGILDRTRVLSLVAAHGEETAVYISLGMPF